MQHLPAAEMIIITISSGLAILSTVLIVGQRQLCRRVEDRDKRTTQERERWLAEHKAGIQELAESARAYHGQTVRSLSHQDSEQYVALADRQRQMIAIGTRLISNDALMYEQMLEAVKRLDVRSDRAMAEGNLARRLERAERERDAAWTLLNDRYGVEMDQFGHLLLQMRHDVDELAARPVEHTRDEAWLADVAAAYDLGAKITDEEHRRGGKDNPPPPPMG